MPGPWEKYQQAGNEGPWSKYQQAEPDPDRGVLEKAKEFGTGAQRGVAGLGLGLTHFLPGDELPFLPESARQARRGARQELQKFADAPRASNYETAGSIFGKDIAPMFIGGPGGRIAGWTAEGATRLAPTLAQLVYALHNPHAILELILARQAGVTSKVQGLFDQLAPHVGGMVAGGTRGVERLAGAEALNAYGRDDAQDTQAPGTQPPPSSSPVPSAPPSGPAGPARGRQPGLDADTDAPVANRSSRGDRLPLYNPAAN